MKLKENAYFNEMSINLAAHRGKMELLREQRDTILQKCGWDSAELKLFDEMRKNVQCQYTDGETKAWRTWRGTCDDNRDADILILDDFLWDREVAGFVVTLRRAGIERFYYTNQSTAVMENIHQLIAAGCKLAGPVTWEQDAWHGKETAIGLEFTVE